jgi:hypothetical protein
MQIWAKNLPQLSVCAISYSLSTYHDCCSMKHSLKFNCWRKCKLRRTPLLRTLPDIDLCYDSSCALRFRDVLLPFTENGVCAPCHPVSLTSHKPPLFYPSCTTLAVAFSVSHGKVYPLSTQPMTQFIFRDFAQS